MAVFVTVFETAARQKLKQFALSTWPTEPSTSYSRCKTRRGRRTGEAYLDNRSNNCKATPGTRDYGEW